MNRYIINKVALFVMATTLFSSCDKVEDITIEGTLVESMSGDWYIQRYKKDSAPSGDYVLISTYNTASNGKEMWIDDGAHDYEYKFKIPVNIDALTFSGTDIESSIDHDDKPETPNYDITVTVSNGKVTLNDTETLGGNMVNGISFDITFSDDTPTPAGILPVHTVKGYKRTGFLEDEH